MVQGGSGAEGTYTADSDVDRMIVLPDMTVHTVKANPENIQGHTFLLDAADSSPGYAKLKLLKLEDTERQILDGYNTSIQEMLEDTNNGTFLSSEKFVSFFVSIPKEPGYYRHGPCATAEHKDTHGHLMGKPGVSMDVDLAHALACDEWPSEAREWISRKRIHNYPPKDVVDKISKQTCHAVPIGDKHSEFFFLEWRISFLLGERELVWNFNDTQVHCYILLKQILKQHVEPLAPDQLSSYHLKTIVFWKSEEKGLSMWYDGNLLQCLLECLSELKKSIEENNLSHYFHRQRNLLAHKLDNPLEKARVLQKIDEIQENIVTFVLNCLTEFKDLSDMWYRCQRCFDVFIEMSRSISDLHESYGNVQKYYDVLMLYRTMFNIFVNITSDDLEPRFILRQLIAFERNPPGGVLLHFLEYTKIFLDIRLGFCYYRHLISPKDMLFQQYIETTTTTLDDAKDLISHGRHIDSLSGVLYLASIYICQSQFQLSNDLILDVIRQNKNLVYPCWCSIKRNIEVTSCGKFKLRSAVRFPEVDERTFPAYDVLFSTGDVDCVPYAVKFECILSQSETETDNFFVIHPCVYAYFLLCIGQYYSGHHVEFTNSLEQLRNIVHDIGDGLQKYRVYNLLGYCYYLDNNLAEAVKCYGKSLKETRNLSNVVNAAAYHLCFLIMQLLKEKEPEIVYERKVLISDANSANT